MAAVVSAMYALGASRHTPAVSVVADSRHHEEVRGSDPRVDRYGNPVSKAVGDYRVGPRGNLYERHAPDTALLKLTPPST